MHPPWHGTLNARGGVCFPTMTTIDHVLRPAWTALRQPHRELPRDVEFIVGSYVSECGPARVGKLIPHAAEESPRGFRVYLGIDRLALGSTATLQTMLHFAAHILAVKRGITDTSQGFRYHNSEFLALGHELGLTLEGGRSPIDGYADMSLAAPELYLPILQRLDRRLPEIDWVWAETGNQKVASAWVAAVCRCDPPKTLRTNRTNLDGSIQHHGKDACGAPFTIKEDVDASDHEEDRPELQDQ